MHQKKQPQNWIERLERFHPYETLLYLAMLASGLIFLYLAVAFVATDGGAQLSVSHMPAAFLLSTGVLLLSGYTASKMRFYYRAENLRGLESALRNTLVLGLAFTVLQFAGWRELSANGIPFTGFPKGSYLYLLSGIHVFHLGGALFFAVILLIQLGRAQDDGVRQLILITNPFEKMKIRLFTFYWLFMDVVWLVLFLLFLTVR